MTEVVAGATMRRHVIALRPLLVPGAISLTGGGVGL
jgi:hypothetical protein